MHDIFMDLMRFKAYANKQFVLSAQAITFKTYFLGICNKKYLVSEKEDLIRKNLNVMMTQSKEVKA